jgi:hypothetical protein
MAKILMKVGGAMERLRFREDTFVYALAVPSYQPRGRPRAARFTSHTGGLD